MSAPLGERMRDLLTTAAVLQGCHLYDVTKRQSGPRSNAANMAIRWAIRSAQDRYSMSTTEIARELGREQSWVVLMSKWAPGRTKKRKARCRKPNSFEPSSTP
jgi:hypothetical protein